MSPDFIGFSYAINDPPNNQAVDDDVPGFYLLLELRIKLFCDVKKKEEEKRVGSFTGVNGGYASPNKFEKDIIWRFHIIRC